MGTHKQTVTFTAPQAEYLRSEAGRLGISFSDVVRRIVDQHRPKTSVFNVTPGLGEINIGQTIVGGGLDDYIITAVKP